jgi:hypothetical protein
MDAVAAQRHLGVALQLLPRDGKILSLFREAASEAARAFGEPAREALAEKRGAARAPDADAPDPAQDEERAARLLDRLRGDPENHGVALELAHVLARLGRDLDLFALLSARLEDATDETRPELLPLQRAVLDRLLAQARRDRRADDEHVYSAALARLAAEEP